MKKIISSIVLLISWSSMALDANDAFVEREVKFESRDKNGPITLSGTLTLPKVGASHPVVIFISGSGPYSRERQEEPFDVLARKFAELGIASLNFDKRGSGKSEGTYITATTRDHAQDVENAIKYLKTIKDINPNKIGLFGHSEGGLIATMLGAWRTDLAFIMLYGAPAMNLAELNRLRKIEQVENAIKKGQLKDEGSAILEMFKALNEMIQRSDLDEEQSLELAKEVLMKAGIKAGLEQKTAQQFTNGILEELKYVTSFTWYREIIKINPIHYFEMITNTTPMLVVNGEADDVVPYKLNIPLIEKALAKAKVNAEIVTLPNILHHFNSTEQGHRPGVAKELMDVFTSWLKRHVVLK